MKKILWFTLGGLVILVGISVVFWPGGDPGYYLQCQLQGGEWTGLSSSCQDYCVDSSDPLHPRACTSDMYSSCECGIDRCWDKDLRKCVDNPELSAPIEIERPDLTL